MVACVASNDTVRIQVPSSAQNLLCDYGVIVAYKCATLKVRMKVPIVAPKSP